MDIAGPGALLGGYLHFQTDIWGIVVFDRSGGYFIIGV